MKSENYGEVIFNEDALVYLPEIDTFKKELSVRDDNEIIILPQRLGDNGQRLFAEESIDFIKFCNKNGANILISQRDEDGMLALHSSEWWLPVLFIGQSILLPFAINLITNYISNKLGKRAKKRQDINIEIVIQDKDKLKSLKFNGDAETFEKKFSEIDINKWSKGK